MELEREWRGERSWKGHHEPLKLTLKYGSVRMPWSSYASWLWWLCWRKDSKTCSVVTCTDCSGGFCNNSIGADTVSISPLACNPPGEYHIITWPLSPSNQRLGKNLVGGEVFSAFDMQIIATSFALNVARF